MSESVDISKNRVRSPAYPAFSLKVALEKAGALRQSLRNFDASVDSAILAMGYKKVNGMSMRGVAALDQFGLIERSGGGDTRKVKLTELAQDVLILPASDARHQIALKKAALRPTVYSHLWERYGSELPEEDTVTKAYLVRDKKFNEEVVDSLLDDYRETLAFAKLDKTDGVSIDISGNGADTESVPVAPQNPAAYQPVVNSTGNAPTPASATPPPSANQSSKGIQEGMELPVLVGDNRIARIPFPMTEDDFDLLIGTLNLWRKKLIKPPQPNPIHDDEFV